METNLPAFVDGVKGRLYTRKKHRWTLLLLSGATVPLILYASNHGGPSSINTETGMYEFKAGTVIDPGEVNDNFSYLASLVNTPDYVSAISVSGDGKVGIGTKMPGTTLQVGGSITTTEALSVAGRHQGDDHIQSNHWFMYQDSNEDFHLARNGWDPLLQISRDDNAIVFNTDASMQSFVIDGAGHVGIGTSEPNELLQVGNAGNQYLYLQANSDGSIPSSGYGLKLGYNYSAGASEADFWNTYESSTMAFQFKQKTGPAAFRDIMTMKSDGNVGIGTIAPKDKLHVEGGGYFRDDTLVALSVAGDDEQGIDRQWSIIGMHDYGEGHQHNLEIWQYVDANGDGESCNGDTDDVCTGRFAINEHGNVGIGTAIPQARLQINSGADDGIRLTDGTTVGIAFVSSHLTNSFAIGTQSNHPLTLGTNNNFSRIVVLANGNVGIGTTSPSQRLHVAGKVTADDYLSNSDIRLKADVEPLEHAAEGIACLQGVKYHWNAPEAPQDVQIGLIAQDVERCFPEVVTTDHDGYKSVSYARLVAPLIENAKEQQQLLTVQQQVNAAQQREIAHLKAEQAATNTRLAWLEALLNARR